ncbi:clock controlled protein [Metarhizium album ARSEF 1941]|uniref:Clock controlled protein n=1 Tax=Metarhizium album (strain ARSEF 1941) TaxID=1081103 RepID=A0A0B2WN61_METAS|nr:clock controlled protein [Metarhizium album ARSEF 1941]KHN94927.1 clock controlled protein [Metarhizium album ARSEF 1941]
MQFSPPPDVDALSIKLPPLNHHDNDKILPSLSSVTGVYGFRGDPLLDHQNLPPQPPHWPPLNGPLAFRQSPSASAHRADSPATMDLDGSNSVASAPSPDRHSSSNSLNLDDPDVRIAAEALGDLRADFVSSPPDTASLAPMSPTMNSHHQTPSLQSKSPQPEPLLSLLTTAHPLVASTIGGASSAYGGAKNFSPCFKSSAEYVEGYLTPLAKTVNSVGRATGVEGGVRWFLGNRRQHNSADSDTNGNSKKRRKVTDGGHGANKKSRDVLNGDAETSPPTPKSERRLSSASTVDTLPAYDEMRSPAYTETEAGPQQPPRSTPSNTSWQSRLIMSTSGLSVAMSAESLRSLKYCLKWLRWTNDHMSQVIGNLKTTLEEYEKIVQPQHEDSEASKSQKSADRQDNADGQTTGQTPEQARTELTNKINTLKVDVLKTLQETINTVSKYAGGALPENARILVRRHLTSLPQRFRLASMSDTSSDAGDKDSDSAVREGAQKVLVLAKEGLDMVTQITGVLDGTIVSAEQWCERMGKRRRPTNDSDQLELPRFESPASIVETHDDVKMAR